MSSFSPPPPALGGLAPQASFSAVYAENTAGAANASSTSSPAAGSAGGAPYSAGTTLSIRPTKKPSILDKPLPKGPSSSSRSSAASSDAISLAAFAFLFSEMFTYSQKRVNGIQDLEKKLSDFGYRVGIRFVELTFTRDKGGRRDTRLLQILMTIHTVVWKALFGKTADSLEKSNDQEDEYMISDNEPLVTKFISVPKELSSLNCGAFVAGIIEAILEGCGFPAQVSAHSVPSEGYPLRTTFLMKFEHRVIAREV